MLHAVRLPVRRGHGFRDAARALLVEKRDAVRETHERDGAVLLLLAAVRERDLYLERVALVDDGRARDRGVELCLDLFHEAFLEQLLADRREAVGRRVHDRGRAERLDERLGAVACDLVRLEVGRDARVLAYLLRYLRRDAREILLQERGERAVLGFREHLDERAEFHAVRVGEYLLRWFRQRVCRAREDVLFGFRVDVYYSGVRVRDRCRFEIGVDRLRSLLVRCLDVELDARAVFLVPLLL